jgi:hypothetical protein
MQYFPADIVPSHFAFREARAMLLGLYPLIQGTGTEKPRPAYFDCWHIADTGETH